MGASAPSLKEREVIIIIVSVLFVVVGIYLLKSWSSGIKVLGVGLISIFGSFLFTSLLLLAIKPYNEKNFQAYCESLARDDGRTPYFAKLEIRKARAFVDDPFIGIFYSRKIANMEIID